jgi:hypothetical protein
MDWRGDRPNGNGAKRPPLAVTLNYLLTAYAQPVQGNGTGREDVIAHQLMGNAMAILHEHPVLNDVHDAEFDADEDVHFPRELRDSFEKVKVTLLPQTMDEFSKIWTGFNKGYRLSVGYEVSLVQIAPILPTSRAALAQVLDVRLDTLGVPLIASIAPASGPAGTQVTLAGSNFMRPGTPTSVMVDDLEIGEADLASLGPNTIVFDVPTVLPRGPRLRVAVFAGGLQSEPVSYEVRPWIGPLRPLRGPAGVPLTIPFDVPAAATASVEIDGAAAATTVDRPNQLVRATVPAATAANGPTPVVLIVDEGTPRRSNVRLYDVLPSIETVSVTTTASPARTTIAVTGRRLNGPDVSVRYGKVLIRRGENLNPTGLSVDVPRILPPNAPVVVLVGNLTSNPLPPRLERLEPPEAFAGDEVMLVGAGLSGQAVSVRFGATDVSVGAQAFASRLTVRVPPALAAGAITVRASVNGNVTNNLPFRVLG